METEVSPIFVYISVTVINRRMRDGRNKTIIR